MRFVLSLVSLVVTVALAAPLFALWAAIVTLPVRPFGIRLPARIWRPSYGMAVKKLSRGQFIITQGILVWGAGVSLLSMLSDYVDFKFGLRGPLRLTPPDLVSGVVLVAVGGTCFGWLMWNYGPQGNSLGSHYDDLSINLKHRD